jgi:hypothetical protein
LKPRINESLKTLGTNRQDSERILRNKLYGVFIVRKSKAIRNSFALSVRVPTYVSKLLVVHYLIEKKNGKFALSGCADEFQSIKQLIEYYSIVRELPVLLNMDFNDSKLRRRPAKSGIKAFLNNFLKKKRIYKINE